MTHNTREWKEIDDKVCDLMMEFGPDGHIDGHEKLTDYIHHQLQKARHDWLRKEIVRLKKMRQVENVTSETESEYEYQVRNNRCIGNNKALQTIIDRYQAELDQPTRDDWNEDMERSYVLAELDQDNSNNT